MLLSESAKRADIAALMTHRLRCPQCKRRYRPQDFHIVESAPQWSVFRLRCAMCLTQRLLIGVRSKNTMRAYATDLDVQEWNHYRRLPPIDADDVVRVARMLKTYDGDFSDVLEDPILDEPGL